MEVDKEGGIYGNATIDVAREKTSVSYQGKGAGRRKEAEESREK